MKSLWRVERRTIFVDVVLAHGGRHENATGSTDGCDVIVMTHVGGHAAVVALKSKQTNQLRPEQIIVATRN